jgi:hypothetical protein
MMGETKEPIVFRHSLQNSPLPHRAFEPSRCQTGGSNLYLDNMAISKCVQKLQQCHTTSSNLF